jgi:Flp pilus assembly protein TadB
MRPDRVAVPCPAASPTDRAARPLAARAEARGRGAATALQRPITEYSEGMNESSSRSIGRMAVAALVLLIAVYVLLKIVLAIALAVALPVAVILAVVAIIWAWRVLF